PVVLGLEPADLGPQLEDREAGHVVNPDRERAEVRRGLGEPAPILRAQTALTNLADVDLALRANHTIGDLLSRHLEREDSDAGARFLPSLGRLGGERAVA